MRFTKFFALIIAFTFYSLALTLPNFIVVGAPGSGKGTFSQYLIDQYGYHQLSIGDLIRSHIKNKTELGIQVQEIVKRGDYIDDTITVQLIAQKIEEFNALHVPFIVDGYPRNQYCLDHLNSLLHRLGLTNTICIVQLDASDPVCAQRIAKRLICLHCAKVSSTAQGEPDKGMLCTCGYPLEKRDFDDPEKTKKRINYYRTNIAPIVMKLKEFYPFYFFNTEQPLAECCKMYEKFMEQFEQA